MQTPGHLPNLLIIGAAKAGTTSLHRYLDLHPAIFMSHDKELQLFNRDDWRDRIGWYREQFPEPAEVRGESSPAYSMDPWFPSVPERIRELIPAVRVVYLVRDPIERLVAQYVEFYSLRRENRSLDDALRDFASPSNRIVMSSRFAYQLDRYREHFDDARILVLDQRDLLESRAATLRETFAFLGVDPDFTSPEFDRLHNERGQKLRIKAYGAWLYGFGVLQPLRSASRRLPAGARERLKLLVADPVSTPALDPALRAEVEAYLREDADRLRAYTGKPFAHWSV